MTDDTLPQILKAAGLDPGIRLSPVDRRLWAAFGRLKARNPETLVNERNRELLRSGRLEYGDAALAREAPASRNTIAANQERLKPILDGLAAMEAARKGAREESRLADREERRSIAEKDRIIDQQASVIAAQQVAIFGLERRIEAVEKRSVKPDKPSPALGRRRQRGRASALQDRAATQAPQS